MISPECLASLVTSPTRVLVSRNVRSITTDNVVLIRPREKMHRRPRGGSDSFAVGSSESQPARANICATKLQQEAALFKLQMKRARRGGRGPRLELLNLSG